MPNLLNFWIASNRLIFQMSAANVMIFPCAAQLVQLSHMSLLVKSS